MVEIWHAFVGPLRKVDVDTAPSTPGVDVSPETSRKRFQIAILLGLGGGFILTLFLTGILTFEQAVHIIRTTPNPANDN